MADPKRNLILEDIDAVLKSISIANGYKTDILTVEREIKEWDSVGQQQLPWLGFMPRTSRIEHDPFAGLNITMPVSIVGHVSADNPVERSDKLADLMDDVIRALQIDTNRGGNAVHTTLIDAEANDGEPDTETGQGGVGSFVMTAEVFYLRTTAGS